jgi:uncharacterized protein with von Willebrand factor type A (vWA) domain
MNQNIEILPLFSFFKKLRHHDFDLGLEEYSILIKALQGGFGLESENGLLFLCKKLWLKSRDREDLFDKLFKDEFENEKQLVLQLQGKKESEAPKKEDIEKEKETKVVEEDKIKLSIEEVRSDYAKKFQKGVKRSISTNKFILKGSYLNVNENRLKHTWRFFRKPEKEGYTDELDIDATVKEIAKQGFLFKPVFVPSKVNKATLITLIDHDGSMAAFDKLAKCIVETSTRGGTVSNIVYYFYNIPHDRLFKNTAHTRAEKKETILKDLEKREAAVLIISDAGAARGRFSAERVDLTEDFIEELKKRTHRIAWINPMPQQRWKNASAHYIKSFVPMFEANEVGISNAVKLLRGKLQIDIFLKI